MAYLPSWAFLMSKLPLYKNSSGSISCRAERDKRFHAFSKSISPKVNVIAQLEFELAYFKVAVQHSSHYATETPLSYQEKGILKLLIFWLLLQECAERTCNHWVTAVFWGLLGGLFLHTSILLLLYSTSDVGQGKVVGKPAVDFVVACTVSFLSLQHRFCPKSAKADTDNHQYSCQNEVKGNIELLQVLQILIWIQSHPSHRLATH